MIRAAVALGLLALPALAEAADGARIYQEIRAIRPERLAKDAPIIPEDAYIKAAKGQTATGVQFVDGEKAGKGWGVQVYPLPIQDLWKAVNDDAAQAGRLPISVSADVAGQPYHSGRYLFQFMPLPIVSNRWWVVHMQHNSALYDSSKGVFWEEAWTDATDPKRVQGTKYAPYLQEGIPVAFTKGAWLLMKLDADHTLAEYFTWSDPGGSLPAGPASRFAGGAIKNALEAVGALAKDLEKGPDPKGFVKPDGTPLP